MPGTADSSARHSAFTFVVNGKGYVGCGLTNAGYTKSFFEYDPVANTWTQKQQFLGTARLAAAGFAIENKGYAGTGYDGNYKNDFYEYDPVTDNWTQKTNYEGTARQNAVGFTIGTNGYIGLGFDGTYKNDIFKYNPVTDTWLALSSQFLGTARRNATCFANSDFAYVGLGYTGSMQNNFYMYVPIASITTGNIVIEPYFIGETISVPFTINGTFLNGNVFTAQLSDTSGSFENPVNIGTLNGLNAGNVAAVIPPEAVHSSGYRIRVISSNPAVYGTDNGQNIRVISNWKQKADFGGSARNAAIGFSIGSKGYIGTGHADFYYLNDFWEYDPASNIWTQKTNFGGTAREGAVGFSIGTKVYIGTGYDGNIKNDFWEYDPASNLWTQKANFGGVVRQDAVGFSIATKGYIGTGRDTGGPLNDFWEYDQVTNLWAQKANFSGTARYRAVGFSIGTKGYIGTGQNSYNNCTNDFWEYDPALNQWSQKTNLSASARTYASGFSIGNKGYIGTGQNGYNVFNDFWEYSSYVIITKSLSETKYFQGDSIYIPYIVNSDFNESNVFTVQLSDENGSFANPVILDSIQGTDSGAIATAIPINIYPGNNYRVRVVGSNPVTIGEDNGTDFEISSSSSVFDENSLSFSIGSIPNPTSSNTVFEFYLTEETEAEIEIYTLTGELVAKVGQSNYSAGIHRVNFDASKLSSGGYNVVLHSGNQRAMTTMIIEK